MKPLTGLQSRTPTKPSGANSSPYIPTKEITTQSGGYFFDFCNKGTRTGSEVNEAPDGASEPNADQARRREFEFLNLFCILFVKVFIDAVPA